jgi:hypothetical protein
VSFSAVRGVRNAPRNSSSGKLRKKLFMEKSERQEPEVHCSHGIQIVSGKS